MGSADQILLGSAILSLCGVFTITKIFGFPPGPVVVCPWL